MYRKSLVAICMLFITNAAQSQSGDGWQNWPMGDPFTIGVSAFFPSLDTKVQVDASDGAFGKISSSIAVSLKFTSSPTKQTTKSSSTKMGW